jgi:acetyl esterase/lipase
MTARPEYEVAPLFDDVEPAHRRRGDRLDVYTSSRPAGERGPAVVFVHGGPVPPGADLRGWPGFAGYGSLAAASGLVGVVFEHRLHSGDHYPTAAGDVAAAVEETRSLDVVDPDRVALWCFSGGGPLAVDWMRATPAWLRCLVWTYPVLAPPPGWSGDVPRFDALAALPFCRDLPKLLMRVEDDYPQLVPDQTAFVAAARAQGAALDVIDVPGAVHGFEGLAAPSEGARTAVRGAMSWAATALR